MSIFVEIFEIDLPRCIHDYGDAPCAAELGTTGTRKCFQSPWTCQDLPNFNAETQTVRFIISTEGLIQDEDLDALPFLLNIEVDPQRLRSGTDLGKRERITVTLKNGRYGDSIFDKYLNERNYNAYERGTWAGKFIARYRNVKGYPCRTISGWSDQLYSERKTRHYIAHTAELDDNSSKLVIEAKDAIEVIEGKKYLFPDPSNGTLVSDIGSGSGINVLLNPVGIGSEYPSSFLASIGDENIQCTRSGDEITITDRGLYGSEITSHSEGDTLQVTGVLEGTAADILYTLFSRTDIDTDWLPKAKWDSELQQANLTRNYQHIVGEPTETWKLVDGLIKDVGLSVFSDLEQKEIIMEVMRNIPSSFSLAQDIMINAEPSINSEDRISAMYILYGRRNPLENIDEDKNYVGHLFRLDPDPLFEVTGNLPEISKHYSRYINSGGRAAADEVSLIRIGRYRNVLRSVEASIMEAQSPRLGQVGSIEVRHFEDDTGSSDDPIKVQVVEITPDKNLNRILFEEFNIDEAIAPDPNIRTVSVPSDLYNVNLKDLYDDAWTDDPAEGSIVEFVGLDGVTIGSESYDELIFAVTDGNWPANVTLRLINLIILGKGGDGAIPNFDGNPGLHALYTRTTMECIDCIIGGGGGGGAGDEFQGQLGNYYQADGGGGAGRIPGKGHEYGTDFEGGAGENNDEYAIGGDGGDIGQPGKISGTGNAGGPPGKAVDGFSYLTLQNTVIYGPTEN